MFAIASLFVRLRCDCFKLRQRLEAEILALRHQLNILQHRTPRRGQHLFRYIDADSESRTKTSSDVNDYLHEITGMDITAKDFRTWAGTVLAAMALSEFESFDSQVRAKKNVKRAIERVAARLGNTPTICRKCYVHPEVLNSYLDGQLLQNIKSLVEAELRDELAGLKPEEAAVLGLVRNRLGLENHEQLRAEVH